jgi:hypothetical protein
MRKYAELASLMGVEVHLVESHEESPAHTKESASSFGS